MTKVDDLIEQQRQMDRPPETEQAETPDVKRDRLEELLEEARLHRLNRWDECPVTLAGEEVMVEIGDTLTGDDWENLTRSHPAKLRADGPYEYDRGAVARAYPLDRIRIDGETPELETWHGLLSVLRPEDRLNIEITMWWMHIGEYQQWSKAHNPHLEEAAAALAVARGGYRA